MNYPQATITAIDTPTEFWYQALTAYGDTCTGVRLYGTGVKFYTGQKVTAFQCGSEYGFSEKDLGYKSQITIPDAQKPSIANEAPASVALAYIAHLAGNDKVYYVPGTVLEIIDTFKMVVESTLSASPLTLTCIITTTGFYEGARVLIQSHPYNARVIGWWNCLPDEEPEDEPEWWTDEDEEWWDNGGFTDLGLHRNRVYAIAIGRIPFSADFDIALIDDEFNWIRSARFVHRDPFSNSCFVSVYPTTNEDEYYYVTAMIGINYSMILERYWIKIHKQTFAMIEMGESQFPPNPGTPYSTTANGLDWWHGATDCFVTDGATTEVAFYSGPTNDRWLPLQNWHYRTDVFKETP